MNKGNCVAHIQLNKTLYSASDCPHCRIAELEQQLSRIEKESEFQAQELNNRKMIIEELEADCKAMAAQVELNHLKYRQNRNSVWDCTCPACIIAAKYTQIATATPPSSSGSR